MKLSETLKQCPNEISFYLEELSNVGIVLIDMGGGILDCNRGFLELLGLKKKPLKHNIKDFLSKSSEKLILPNDSFVRLNLMFMGGKNTNLLFKGYISPLQECYLMIFEQYKLSYSQLIIKMSKLNNQIVNMTRELEKKNVQLKDAIATVKRIMNTDHLTGILNRRALDKNLKREISFALRHKLPLSFVMADIDNFKKINDNYGHEVGDFVLKSFTKALKKSLRQEDMLGRYGGEEFVLVLPNTDIEKAFQASERIRHKIEKLKIKEINGNITASFGITGLLSTDDEKSLIKRADDALYEAKKNGRNRCEIKK